MDYLGPRNKTKQAGMRLASIAFSFAYVQSNPALLTPA